MPSTLPLGVEAEKSLQKWGPAPEAELCGWGGHQEGPQRIWIPLCRGGTKEWGEGGLRGAELGALCIPGKLST